MSAIDRAATALAERTGDAVDDAREAIIFVAAAARCDAEEMARELLRKLKGTK